MSFIERQFPVSKVSKESFKERKANNGQTLTGLGKWWGRKPLILVRAAILGCLMPASDNPKKDTEIFLKILSMDKTGLADRKTKKIPPAKLYEIASRSKHFRQFLEQWFVIEKGKAKFRDDVDKDDIEMRIFNTLGYDERLEYSCRPEHLSNIRDSSWREINEHLDTKAYSLKELINQLSMKRYGKLITVGDCFSGGGSIPFEAARIGAYAYGSDLNPIASLLTWANVNILGADEHQLHEIEAFRQKVYDEVNKEIVHLGIEVNEKGDRALSYLYCVEATCPECGYKVPLAPSWVIGKGTKTVALLKEVNNGFDIEVKMNAKEDEIKAASIGTVNSNALICPHCKKSTPISSIRHDTIDENGNIINSLRKWTKTDFDFHTLDVFSERLYAVKYEHSFIESGKLKTQRYYTTPSSKDLENELKIHNIIKDNLEELQATGFIPSTLIEKGMKTSEVIKTRGWSYWHQLFNPRQLLLLSLFEKYINKYATSSRELVVGMLGLNKCADMNSKLCVWHSGGHVENGQNTFLNQALNPLFNYSARALNNISTPWYFHINNTTVLGKINVALSDARDVTEKCELWITDPPYADAVMYHELTEFFLAWDKSLLLRAFPDWYTDSKRVLAVRGDEHFSETMIEIYSNLAKHMPDNGMQIVMFTHSDPAVWAQLAIIMWKSGLKVTAAWNIATETEASGLKIGNYVKGTVLLVLRKQTGDEEAFLDEIDADIRSEVKRQIDSMQTLDDKEEPNFSDPDYVLAAYAASLKVLTSYAEIEDLNLDYELTQAITNPSKSEVVKIIESAKRIAYDCVIPSEFESYLWKELSNSERFYIKGLESEKHGDYQIATYQEYARGFSIGGYSQLMANEKANTARLKTPFEMASRSMNDVPDFENSLMRVIFSSIYVGIKEEMNPQKALGYIKGELANYWDKREMIKQILSFLVDCQDISNMQPHWTDCSKMADLLLASVTHDSI